MKLLLVNVTWLVTVSASESLNVSECYMLLFFPTFSLDIYFISFFLFFINFFLYLSFYCCILSSICMLITILLSLEFFCLLFVSSYNISLNSELYYNCSSMSKLLLFFLVRNSVLFITTDEPIAFLFSVLVKNLFYGILLRSDKKQ